MDSWGLSGSSWAAVVEPLGAVLGHLGALLSPLPPILALDHSGPNSLHPNILNLTQLKHLILAGEFSVKVDKRPAHHPALLTLKRPKATSTRAREGESLHWVSPSLYRRPWSESAGQPLTPPFSHLKTRVHMHTGRHPPRLVGSKTTPGRHQRVWAGGVSLRGLLGAILGGSGVVLGDLG